MIKKIMIRNMISVIIFIVLQNIYHVGLIWLLIPLFLFMLDIVLWRLSLISTREKRFKRKMERILSNRFREFENQILEDLIRITRLGQIGISVPVPDSIRENKALVDTLIKDLNELDFQASIHGVQMYIQRK